MRESPRLKLWQDERDEQLRNAQWTSPEGVNHYLEQSICHSSLWYIMEGKKPKEVRTVKAD
eukprot:6143422-Amphidinium_carterae.1